MTGAAEPETRQSVLDQRAAAMRDYRARTADKRDYDKRQAKAYANALRWLRERHASEFATLYADARRAEGLDP